MEQIPIIVTQYNGSLRRVFQQDLELDIGASLNCQQFSPTLRKIKSDIILPKIKPMKSNAKLSTKLLLDSSARKIDFFMTMNSVNTTNSLEIMNRAKKLLPKIK